MATCEERIDENLERTIEDLRTLWDLYCEDTEAYDDDLGNIYEYGLSFDYVAPDTFKNQPEGYFRYQLSWGGPSDEFRFFATPVIQRVTGSRTAYYLNALRVGHMGWKHHRIEYWFLDWFDGAHRILRGKDFKLLSEIFEWFDECGTTQHVFEKEMADY